MNFERHAGRILLIMVFAAGILGWTALRSPVIWADGLRYREEGRFEKSTQRYTVKVVPNRLADKLNVEGLMVTQSLGDKQCKRVFTASVNVKIFGVGGMIEKRIASDLQRSYDAGARFTAKYLQEKGL